VSSVTRVMHRLRAALVFTSLPYGNQRDYTTAMLYFVVMETEDLSRSNHP